MTIHQDSVDVADERGPRDVSLVGLFAGCVAEHGEAVAVVGVDGVGVSFAELDRRSSGLARRLVGMGVGVGDRVAVRMRRGVDAVVCLLAVLKAGAAYVPVDPRYPVDRQVFVLEHSRSAVVLTERALPGVGPVSAGVPVVVADEASAWGGFDQSAFAVPTGPDDAVYVIYTSGSTGRPKGVLGRQAGTVNRIAWGWRADPFGADEVVAQRTSLMFVDSVWEIFGPLLAGVPIAVIADEVVTDPRALVEVLAERRVTRIVLVPALVDAILDTGDDLALRLPSLRRWVSSGEALRLPTVRRFHRLLPEARLINLYGSSEVSADVTWYDTAELPDDAQAVPLGRPLAGVAITITGDDGEPVPQGVPGEIRVSGPAVALGYLDLPVETAERFSVDADGDPVFRTGDLGRWNEDGVLDYRGRRDDQVKIRGNRVELGEVESVLRQHRDISAAAVAVRERAGGPALVAYVVSSGPLDMRLMRTFVRKRLPEYMVPVGFVSLAQLPLTPNGKVDRNALPDTRETPLDDRDHVAPTDDLQRALTGIFEEILEHRPIGITDDFFDLGGHSLLAARGIARIEALTGTRLSVRDFFEHPTPEGLAARVRSVPEPAPGLAPGASDEAPVVAADALSLVQQRFWLFEQMRPDTALYNLPAVVRLRGSLSADALERALRDVIERHGSLRSTIRMGEQDPHVLVSPAPDRVLDVVDLRDVSAAAIPGLLVDEARRPFDLEHGPLIRATLYRTGEQDHLFAPVLHHVISDGASLGIFYRDLSIAYRARLAGAEPHLPPLAADYPAFATWQRRRLTPSAIERELEYWRAQLKTAPRLLDLPTDHPRRARQTFRGGHVPLQLDANLASSLRVLASDARASLFMVLLAAFQTLLGRMAGQDDVVIGAPTAGRIGARVRGRRRPLHQHARPARRPVGRPDVPRAARPHARHDARRVRAPGHPVRGAGRRDRHRPPRGRVLALLPEHARARARSGGRRRPSRSARDLGRRARRRIDVRHQPVPRREARRERQRVRRVQQRHLRTGDDRPRVRQPRRAARRCRRDARRAPRRPGSRDEDARTGAGGGGDPCRRRFPPRWPGCSRSAWRSSPGHRPSSGRRGDVVLSFGELDRRSNGLARHLQGLGVGVGDRVAVRMRRGADAVVCLLAVLKAGAAYVPVDPRYPAERQAFVLEHSQSAVVLTERALIADGPASLGVPVIAADEASAWEPFDTSELRVSTGPDDAIYVIYTSGSTGRPKGVLGRQAGTVNRIVWGSRAHPFDRGGGGRATHLPRIRRLGLGDLRPAARRASRSR